MVKEIAGGSWLAGLVCWAILGIIPGLLLFFIGGIAASWELIKSKQAAANEESWRKNYPPYGY